MSIWIRRRFVAAGAALCLPFLAGCPSGKDAATTITSSPGPVGDTSRDASKSGAFAQTDPWLLSTDKPDADRGNHGIYLSNGTIGATFGKTGTGDKQSILFRAGVYDASENLAPLPANFAFQLPEPKGGTYKQTLDIKQGVLVTEYDGKKITAFVSATKPDLIVFQVTNATKDELIPQSGDATATEKTIKTADGKTRYFCSDSAYAADPADPKTFTVCYAVSEGATAKAAKDSAYSSAQTGVAAGFTALLEAHEAQWTQRWSTASVTIDGDPEAQQMVNKAMFDLLQSVRAGGDSSIAPEALSGDFYKGHIFWDADIWMFPALLAQNPEAAKNLLDYRYKHLPQAQAIAKSEGLAGADYPWESADTGKETAPQGFSTERHVTAGVGFAVWQYWLATGDAAWLKERGYPVLSAVAAHWASRAKKNATGKYEIKGVFGPDENKGKVDNNTYTNALAKYCLEAATKAATVVGKPADPRWAEVAKNLALPFDKAKGAYLARDADELKSTKQADGELVLYPARLPMDKATAEKTFDLHAPRPIKAGPAMTTSMHALIASRLGRGQEAENYFRDSYRPFARGPFDLFSEKRSMERCVFTTGLGGVMQSVLYGFGGLDFDTWGEINKTPVALPASWKSLTIRGIVYHGKRYTMTVTKDGRTLEPTH